MTLAITKEEERDVMVWRIAAAFRTRPLQARFIEMLAHAEDGAVSHDDFAQHIYGGEANVDTDRVFKVMATHARSAIADVLGVPRAEVFDTIYGKGYVMSAEIAAAVREAASTAKLKPSEHAR